MKILYFLLVFFFISCSQDSIEDDIQSLLEWSLSKQREPAVLEECRLKQVMEVLCSAENNCGSSAKGYVYLTKGVLYHIYDNQQQALLNLQIAGKNFLNEKNYTYYNTALIYLAYVYKDLGDLNRSIFCLDILKSCKSSLSTRQKECYDELRLEVESQLCPLNYKSFIEQYIYKYNDVGINWLLILRIALDKNDMQLADKALMKCNLYNGPNESIELLRLASKLYEKKDDFAKSLECMKSISLIDNGIDLHFFEREFQYDRSIKRKGLLISALLLLLFLITFVGSEELWRYRTLYKDSMNKLEIANSRFALVRGKFSSFPSQDLLVIENRLSLLDNYIIGQLCGNRNIAANDALKRFVDDHEGFMSSTQETFKIINPKFIEFLKKQKLSSDEVSYCCLYVTGFTGKLLADYLGMKRCYEMNMRLRRKLGLYRTNINISTYLKNKFHELKFTDRPLVK